MAPTISDQKKRALEALERRFAINKAKIVQQEEHKSKKNKGNPKGEREVLACEGQRGEDHDLTASPIVIDQRSSLSSRKGEIF